MRPLTLAGNIAEPLMSGGYACTRRGAAFPTWTPDRGAAMRLLREWAALDRPPSRGEADARLAAVPGSAAREATTSVGAGDSFPRGGEVGASRAVVGAPTGRPG